MCGEAYVLPLSFMALWVRPDEFHQTFNFRFLDSNWSAGDLFANINESFSAFDSVGALHQLEAFASFHGPAFYGLPRNSGTVTLQRESWTTPESFRFGEAELKPLRGGEALPWKLQA